jgi:GrpB-like predicted nucleotidyltransferase (UPF0157 family)
MSKETQPLANRPPLAEEQIRTNTIRELKPLSGRIVIEDFDPHWPELFGREADRIRAVLGCRVLRIEHTGSTSVAGLVAKPILDMLLVIRNSADEDAYPPVRKPRATCFVSARQTRARPSGHS